MKSREAQLQYEIARDTEAAQKRLKELLEAAANGDTELPRASRLIAGMYEGVKAHLEEECNRTNRGPSAKYRQWLRALPLEVSALIAVRTCIKLCSADKPAMLQDVTRDIGKQWELEVRIREAEKVNPMYMQRIHEQVKRNATRSSRHLRNLYNSVYDRVMKGELDSRLDGPGTVQVGRFGLEACVKAGLVEVLRGTSSKGTLLTLQLVPEALEFVRGYGEQDVMLVTDKAAGSMMCPPDEWSTVQDGGYISLRRKFVAPLLNVRRVREDFRQRIRDILTAENVPQVFRVANYLQSIPYTTHEPTTAAIRRVYESGGGILGVPRKNAPERPPCPLPEAWKYVEGTPEEQATFNAWKRRCVLYYEDTRVWRARTRELHSFLKSVQAELYWLPVHVDRRCRWYYRGGPNPQGSDLSKAVLRFGEAKPLGEDGLFWLWVQLANSLGYDKVRMHERAAWAKAQWPAVLRALDAPEECADTLGKDAPWMAFSTAWEIREALRLPNPAEYRSGLIVALDATCSGLQHFSAMLRDSTGAQYVNLLDAQDGGPKQDIYAKVRDEAMSAMRHDLEHGEAAARRYAEWWLAVGITRTLAKGPVMTYCYGATLMGTRQDIEFILASEAPHATLPEDSLERYRLLDYAARKLFAGIESAVPAAAKAMRWLKDVVRDKPNEPLLWKAPTGFPVLHDYQKFDKVRVSIRSMGIRDITVRKAVEGTHSTKMTNSIAPNLVHALDASHMAITADRMRGQGYCLAGVHDSFGTHACDVRAMRDIVRQSFADMYASKDILGDFVQDIDSAKKPPQLGDFDIQQVVQSEYFVC